MWMKALLALGAATGVAAWWWRTHPSACPYGQRFWVEAPHPLITRRRLLDTLAPVAGERLLEVGPGTGYYTLDVASAIGRAGSLDIFDVQQQMLDHAMGRVRSAGLSNVVPTRGDVRSLPYDGASFDGAFLVTVLGEVPDQQAALRELARVLKPGGRLVVGEVIADPHYVRLPSLVDNARTAGLTYERRVGSRLGYFASFCR